MVEPLLIAGVVAGDEHEAGPGLQLLVDAVDVDAATKVGEWMQDDDHVRAGLGHLVQVENRVLSYCPCDRTVLPYGVATADQVSAQQIDGRGVVVTRHGDERPTEPYRHVLDEA